MARTRLVLRSLAVGGLVAAATGALAFLVLPRTALTAVWLAGGVPLGSLLAALAPNRLRYWIAPPAAAHY